MKKAGALVFVFMLIALVGCGNSPAIMNEPAPLSIVKTNVPFLGIADNPTLIDAAKPIFVEFSEPLDSKTIAKGIAVWLITAKGQRHQEILATVDVDNPQKLSVVRADGAQFEQGQLYVLAVSKMLKSVDGARLGTNYEGYFASSSNFTLCCEDIPALKNERSLIICISDVHLGIRDDYAECVKNRPSLVAFLGKLREMPTVKELVLGGDIFDEWFIPAETDTFNGKTQLDFVQDIAKNNDTVMAALNAIISDGKIKVTYVPGNHDLLVTAADIQSVLPGISQARDVQGLGAYSPEGHPEIIIEHGHRYNFFCAPDPISNKSVAPGSILPPGYFFTRIATSSVVQKHPKAGSAMPAVTANQRGESQRLAFAYWNIWKTLIEGFPIQEAFDDKIIKTNIDGFTETYSINDLMPYQRVENGSIDFDLFRGIQDSWGERQTLNMVAVPIPASEAISKAGSASELDGQATTQYFSNPASDKRIVVFGHTHEPRIIPSTNLAGKKTIYANTGTWIDRNRLATMTFIVVSPPARPGSILEYVDLYYYSADGSITKMDAQALSL